ncbi:PKD domain-containing protein [Ferdinandcohnia sp. SAFN-114]|uniref:PKD domain-containing protein n=1 Tax=Ferdinandcohnia sp. SAFN-114 TaxID=3387275 RepID=UPI003F814FC2
MRTGRNIVYDIYSSKYISGGYQIVNKTFSGHSNQPYLRFTGWAVNFGHKHHTSSNHETYIVAQRTSDNSTRIYSTIPINLSATEEVEYNNQGSGVWNQCPSTATNKSNIPSQDSGCNMTYVNVGFDAYIPLNELVPDKNSNTSWRLYLVKRVDSHIVYTELILPFTLSNLSFNSDTITGKISLSSGVNANQLMMRSSSVIRRTAPRSTSGSGSTLGYFVTGQYYTRTTQDETGTTVWYGVADGGGTRWTSSSYWAFGGSQAIISYDAPPKHNSAAITGHNYKNGNDYWAKPNDPVNIELRQYDQTGNARQYLMLNGNGVDARAWHNFAQSSTWFDYFLPSPKSPHVDITAASRIEHASGYGKIRWTVNPKTHGHSYDVRYYYQDTANNTIGYNSTGLKLRVDGVAPVLSWNDVQNAGYVNGNTYWYLPGSTATVKIQQKDPDSGNAYGYMRLGGNGVDARFMHNFGVHAWNHIHQFGSQGGVWYDNTSNPHVPLVSGGSDGHSDPTIEQLAYTVRLNTHGHLYSVEYHFIDKVGNTTNGYGQTGKYIGVDGAAPTVQFRNSADTANYPNRDWSSAEIRVRLKHSDAHSGYKRSRYHWSTSTSTPAESSWSSWTTSSNYEATKSGSGQWYLHVQSEDNLGNRLTTYSGPYKFNTPPVPDFTWNPSTIYNDTNVTFTNRSSDADGHTLTYQWAYLSPGSNTWVNFSTAKDPTRILNKQEVWKIRLTVSDSIESRSVEKSITVLNRTPVPNFTATPNPTDRLTTVTFTNSSTDPDKDVLAYVWEYRIKGTTTWTRMATTTNASFKFPKVATYEVRLTASDNWVSASKTIDIVVKNIKPVVELTYELPTSPLPNEVWEGDTVKVCAKVTDAENDPLTVKIYLKKDGGTEQVVLNQSNLTSGSKPCYTFVTEVGRYDIRVTVNDPYDEIGTSTWFNSKDLILISYVKHTPDWLAKHNDLGHAPHQFYSGERFLLESDVSPYPVKSLTSTMNGYQSNDISVTRLVNLSKVSNILYIGELYDQKFLEHPTNLKVGPVSFLFKVKYVNGVVEEYTVPIEIIADGFEQYRIHRKY